MHTPSTLFLAGALALLAPAVSAAQVGSLFVVPAPTGQLTLDITGPGVTDVHVSTPITIGCIEIQEGPEYADVGKHFILTRFSLQFADFSVPAQDFGTIPLRQVAAQMRDALTWWGVVETPGVAGIYTLEIMHDNDHRYGEPVFIAGAKVDPSYFADGAHKDVPPFIVGEQRVSEPIKGKIDLANRMMTATAVFKDTISWPPIVPVFTVDRTMTITFSGAIEKVGSATCGGPRKGVN